MQPIVSSDGSAVASHSHSSAWELLPYEPDVDRERSEHPPRVWPAAKAAADNRVVFGDVTRDDRIDLRDVLFLLGHIQDPAAYPVLFDLADVNKDGAVTSADAFAVARYLDDPLINPYRVGDVVRIEWKATLSPEPIDRVFRNDGSWHTFQVRTSVDSVIVTVNGTGIDPVLEIAGGSRAPGRSYCPPEKNDSPRRPRRNGWSLHLSGCDPGKTQVVLTEYGTGRVLNVYEVVVKRPLYSRLPKLYFVHYPDGDPAFARMNLDGTGYEKMFRASPIWRVDFDFEADKVYWQGEGSEILRADLDGANMELAGYTGGQKYFSFLAAYGARNRAYVLIPEGERHIDEGIWEVSLFDLYDNRRWIWGSSRTEMELDNRTGALYFWNNSVSHPLGSGWIWDGNGANIAKEEDPVIPTISNLVDIEVTYTWMRIDRVRVYSQHGKLYWQTTHTPAQYVDEGWQKDRYTLLDTDNRRTFLRRANLDGSEVETLFEHGPELEAMEEWQVDGPRQALYFTNGNRNRLYRSNLDRSDPVEISSGTSYLHLHLFPGD